MIIALLTDFGTQDYFVGAMKGAILTINPAAQIIDITHEIAPQSIKSASFTLLSCYKNFPEKSIFVAVVDPGVGSDRRAILVETDKYYFIAPDNGLLSFVFEETEISRVFEFTNKKYFAEDVSQTFHGRDVFAPVAAHLSNGVAASSFGKEIKDFIRLEVARPRFVAADEMEAEIIHIDRFGNLITNLKRENLPKNFYLVIGNKKLDNLKNFYAEANTGEIFMIFGSAGFLEIVAFQMSAKSLLNAESGQKFKIKLIE